MRHFFYLRIYNRIFTFSTKINIAQLKILFWDQNYLKVFPYSSPEKKSSDWRTVEMFGISQICTITLMFRLAPPEFHLTACRAAGSPFMTALTKLNKSATADWYLPLHLISIQHCRTWLATAFIAFIHSLSSSPWTWFLWLERVWNAAISEILLARSWLWTKGDRTGDRRKHLAQRIHTRVICTER